jgi:spore germination cell wall hydrolase CwlJ-like protein
MKSKTVLVAIAAAITIFTSVVFALSPNVGNADTSFIATAVAKQPTKTVAEDLKCLALNIYHESRGSNLADKAAVADVVINRKKDRRYPNSICGVVQQSKLDHKGFPKKNQCQFSWYCDGKSDDPKDADRWEEAKLIAHQVLIDGKYRGISEGATHYHATYVNPKWAASFQQVGRIGEHIFYRWE